VVEAIRDLVLYVDGRRIGALFREIGITTSARS